MTTAEIQASPEARDTNPTDLRILENFVEIVEVPTKVESPFVAYLESRRDIFDDVIGGDQVDLDAITEYRNVLDLLSLGQGGYKEPISLAELCIDCTPTEKLTDNLIDYFLCHIPGVMVRNLNPAQQGGMLSKLYEFKDDTAGTDRRLRARVFRVEHDFNGGERRAYYSLSRGSI